MVEFFDTIANQNISYHIAPALIKLWDKLRDGGLERLNEDRIYLVDGREGTGKSSFTFQQAKYLDPSFTVDRIVFNPKQFLELLRTAPQGAAIVFDEAFRGLSSKGSRSQVNRDIVEALMEVRQRNLIIFIVLPTIFLLEIYAAVFRSEGLLHVYKLKEKLASGERKRGFRIYNYEKKKLLYLRGRAKYFSYALPKIKRAKGKFFVKKDKANPKGIPYETFELDKYLTKKNAAFGKKEDNAEESGSKYKLQRDLILKAIYTDFVKSQPKLSDWLMTHNIEIAQRTISQIFGNLAKTEEILALA